MTKFGGAPVIYDLDPYTDSTIQQHRLGARAETADGRKFRYHKAVAATVAGKAYSSAGQDAQFESMAVPAIEPIGETSIGVTLGTTTVAANDFDGGYLVISSSTGIGQFGQILSHGTGTSGLACSFVIDRPLETALATTSKVTIVKNPYDDVIVQATTPVAPVMGLATSIVAAASFGWIATGGAATALMDAGANITVDTLAIAPSTTTEGCVARFVEANSQMLGFSMQVVSVDAYNAPVFLTLD